MCLAALSLRQHDRFPLILAANRDEYFARPASPVAWWSPRPDGTPILSGRDLEAGGTWLGLSGSGRLALLTNVREPQKMSPRAPSRGALVTDWLESTERAAEFWQRHGALPYNGFNLIAADTASGEWFWGSNRVADTVRMPAGLYGLSNAALDTPWPKVTTLKQRTATAAGMVVSSSGSVASLALLLFMALADRSLVVDDALPSTGVPREWEKLLSPAFIDAPERGYGTRCSTVVVTERHGAHETTHVFELTHATDGLSERPDRRVSGGFDAGRAAVQAEVDGLETALDMLPGMSHLVLDDWSRGWQ